MAVVRIGCRACSQTTGQEAGEAKVAETRRAECDSLSELGKIPGVLEEGIISFHHR